MRRALSLLALSAWLPLSFGSVAPAQSPAPPPVSVPQVAFGGRTLPLLSLDMLRFLEGTWTAVSRDGRQSLGAYTFARELNGAVLSRVTAADPGCAAAATSVCGRRDLFYIYQDSPGAPLHAISFDREGRVLHYLVSQAAQADTSTLGRRDVVIFDTDPAMFGPRLRLRYEHNIDTATGRETMNGAVEALEPDGTFRPLEQWYGNRR